MKAELLKRLREANDYVSGQQLCEHLGVSRTAVWKMIHQLKGEGYEIELIMPLTDDGVYAEWLRDKGPGIHHIKFETNDSHDEICSRIEAASGRKPYLHAEWPDGRTLVDYADLLQECGLLIEVN